MIQKTQVLRPQTVRGTNSAVVLQLLRRFGALSRVELARQSGLSEATVSRITAGLLRRRLIHEDGPENSTGGRPATRLRLDRNKLGVGVDVHAWEMRCAVATLAGELIDSVVLPAAATPQQALLAIAEQFRVFENKFDRDRIEGIGVSVRGLVNRSTGVVELGNQPGWANVSVREQLEAMLNVPVHVDNNVRLAAIAEHDYGDLAELHESRCLLFVMVDEGIGIGIVLDGKLYYGPRHAAGEFGQMVIADQPGTQRHDRPGCLERLASSLALRERYASLKGTDASATAGDMRAEVHAICHRAMQDDGDAMLALGEVCRYLGVGISNVIWGLNADAVVLNATINEAWPIIAPLIQQEFPDGSELINFKPVVLRRSSLSGDGSLIGAATLPFHHLFHSDEQASAQAGAASA